MQVTVHGTEEVVAKVDAVRGRLANMRPVLQVAAEDIRTLIDDRFETSTGPDGTQWQPLAETTIERRRNRSDKPLVDTGALRNSIVSRVQGARSFRFGTNLPYAARQQFGFTSSKNRPHPPARPFLPIDATHQRVMTGPSGAEWRHIRDMIEHWIRTGEIR